MRSFRSIASEINKKEMVFDTPTLDRLMMDSRFKVSEALFNLYDLNILGSPSIYEESSLRAYLVEGDLDPSDTKLLYGSGCIDFSLNTLKVVIDTAKDVELRKVLINVYNYKYHKAFLDAFEHLYTHSIMKSSVVSVDPSLHLSPINCTISSRLNFLLNPERVVQALAYSDTLKKYSFNSILLKTLVAELGIPKEEILKHREENRSLFLEGGLFDHDKELVEYILDGDFYPNSDWGTKLVERVNVKELDKDSYMFRMNLATFKEMIYKKSYEVRLKLLCDVMDNTLGEEVIFLTQHNFFTINKKVSAYTPREIEEYGDNLNFAMKNGESVLRSGLYLMDWDKGELLPSVNMLKGISGEYISTSTARDKGYTLEGAPTLMLFYARVGKKTKFYIRSYHSIDQVYYSTGKKLNPKVGVKFHLEFTPVQTYVDRAERRYGKTLPRLVEEIILNASKNKLKIHKPNPNIDDAVYNGVIRDMVLAFFYIEVGHYMLKGREHLGSLNALELASASFDADNVFVRLMSLLE